MPRQALDRRHRRGAAQGRRRAGHRDAGDPPPAARARPPRPTRCSRRSRTAASRSCSSRDRRSRRVVVVTGASSGIGRADGTASRRARRPPRPGRSRGRRAGGRRAGSAGPAGPRRCWWCRPTSATTPRSHRASTAVRGHHDRVDAVVNAAGVVAYGRTEDVPPEVFDGVLRTNLIGSVNVARHALPVLRAAGGRDAGPGRLGHRAHRGAVDEPVRASASGASGRWRASWRWRTATCVDVHIVYVAPGGVDTPIYAQAANYDGFVGRPPPPVLSPERVAEVVLAPARPPAPPHPGGTGPTT